MPISRRKTRTPAQRKKRYDTVLMTIIVAFVCPLLVAAVIYIFSADKRLIKVEIAQNTILENQKEVKTKNILQDTEIVLLKVKMAVLESADKKKEQKYENIN